MKQGYKSQRNKHKKIQQQRKQTKENETEGTKTKMKIAAKKQGRWVCENFGRRKEQWGGGIETLKEGEEE